MRWVTVSFMMMVFSQTSMLLTQDEVQQVFSGPQPGESMDAFDVQYAFGVTAGSTMEPLKEAGDKPTLLIFVHQFTRPSSGANPQTTKSLSVCCTISDDKTVRFWQPSIGRMVRFYQMKSAMPLCMAPAVNRTGGFEVTVGTSDGRIITVDYKTVKVQFEKQVSKVGIEVIAKHPHKEAWMTGDSAGVLRIVSE
jgi:hypothetical protein